MVMIRRMATLEECARDFARSAHQGQQYGGGSFFDLHLTHVVDTLRRFGERDETILAAGWLHDVLEDTQSTPSELEALFGKDVADLVVRLTDVKGGSRRERQTQTHANIRGRAEAVRVKLADRIANVQASIDQSSPLLDGMYRKEYPRFRADLFREGEFESMWTHLDGLLLRPE